MKWISVKDKLYKHYIICKIFGHKFKSSNLEEWEKDRINFICMRCGKRVQKFTDALWKNR